MRLNVVRVQGARARVTAPDPISGVHADAQQVAVETDGFEKYRITGVPNGMRKKKQNPKTFTTGPPYDVFFVRLVLRSAHRILYYAFKTDRPDIIALAYDAT